MITVYRQVCVLFIAVFTLAVAPGCGLPGTSSKDEGLKVERSYRESNPSCSNLDLESSSLTPASLRGLVACLNTQGHIPEFERLVNVASDEDLAPLTDLVGRLVLTRPDRLFLFDQTFQAMLADGSLDRTLGALSGLLKYPAIATTGLRVGAQIYFSGETSVARYVLNGLQGEPNTELLQTAALLGAELNAQNAADILQTLIALTDVRAFGALQGRLVGAVAADVPSLESALQAVLSYLRKSEETNRVEVTERLLALLSSGEAWALLDDLIDDSSPNEMWLPRVHEWSDMVSGLYANRGQFLGLAPGFMAALKETETNPVLCFLQTTALQAIGPQRVFSELSVLGLMPFLNTLVVSRPFCGFDPAILSGAQALLPLAASSGGDALTQIAKSLVAQPGLLALVTDLLSERGESGARLPVLAPAVARLLANDTLKEALVLATTYKVADRPLLNRRLEFLSQTKAELGGKSIITVLAPLLKHGEVAEVATFLRSVVPLMEDQTAYLGPLLKETHNALGMSSAHPMLDVVKDVLVQAPRMPDVFSAVFRIAARHPVQLERVLTELSQMSRPEDGRMRNVLTSFFALFSVSAERGRVAISAGTGAGVRITPRHNIIAAELPPVLRLRRSAQVLACQNLDLNFSLADVGHDLFSTQFASFAACMSTETLDADYEQTLSFIGDRSTLVGALSGQSLWSYGVGIVQDFAASSVRAVSEAVGKLVPALRDGRVLALVRTTPVLVNERVFNPLLTFLKQVPWAATEVATSAALSVEERRRVLLTKSALVCSIAAVDPDAEPCDEWGDEVCLVPVPTCEALPLARAISTQLSVFEPRADINARTEQIINEYLTAVSHHSPAREWSETEFLGNVNRLHDALINTRTAREDPQGANTHRPLEGVLSFLKSINGKMNAFHPEARQGGAALEPRQLDQAAARLSEWMITEANTLRVIPYYYPGEREPRVRLLNNLDSLALVLNNSRIKFSGGTEPGIIGLLSVPQAWAEEAEEAWPEYLNPDNNFTLAKIVDVLLQGVPNITGCYRPGTTPDRYTDEEWLCVGQFYNLKGFPYPSAVNPDGQKLVPSLVAQLLSYLPPDQVCSRSPFDCFGLKVVRNLFSAVHQKTPAQFRSIFDPQFGLATPWVNPRVLQELMDTGVMRAVGRALFNKDPRDQEIYEFFRAAVHLSAHPHFDSVVAAAKSALAPEERGQDWSGDSRDQPLMARLATELFRVRHDESLARLGFYSVAGLKKLGLFEAPTDLVKPMARVLTGLTASAGPGRPVAKARARELAHLLVSDDLATLVEHGFSTAGVEQFLAFRQHFAVAKASSAYPVAELDALAEDILEFLEHPPVPGTQDAALYEQTLELLIRRGAAGDLEALMRSLGAREQDVLALLQAAARFEREGGAARFIERVGGLLNAP